MNIYQRINKVMQEVKYLRKDAQVQGYKAVTHDNLVGAARQSLVDNGIALVVNQLTGKFDDAKEGSKMRLYTGRYQVALINIEKPDDSVTIEIESQAMDNGDKATGKAMTYATKNALLKLLWLETGENDESRQELKETQEGLNPATAQEYQAMVDLIMETKTDINKLLSACRIPLESDNLHQVNQLQCHQMTQKLKAKANQMAANEMKVKQ